MADETLSGRITSILDRLTAISRMAPGMPLRAEDWNTVISAVIDLARLQGTQAGTSTAHDHKGQVSRDWLDVPLGDFVDSTRALQTGMQEQIKALGVRMDRLETRFNAISEQVSTLQSTVDSQADGALDRDITLKRVGDRVDNLDLLGSQVADVRTQLTLIDPQLKDALRLRSELTGPEGVLPDLGAMQNRINDLDKLQENLRLADGSIGRLRDLERRLDTFEAIGTNEDVLASRVDSLVFEAVDSRGLIDRESFTGLFNDLLIPELEPVRTGLDAVTIDFREVMSAVDRVTRDVNTTFPRLDALESSVADTRGLTDSVRAMEDRLLADERTLDALSRDVVVALSVRDQVGAIDASLADLSRKFDSFQGGTVDLSGIERQLASLDSRVFSIEGQTSDWVRSATFQDLDSVVNQMLRDMRSLDASINTLDRSFNDYRTTTDARLDQLGGRTFALQEATSKLSLDLGNVNLKFDAIHRPTPVLRGPG